MLLGSVSHQISKERRKIAWTEINPKVKPLAEEVYSKREGNLFGPTLEIALKRIELDKTMSKVSEALGSSYQPRDQDLVIATAIVKTFEFLGGGVLNPSTAGRRVQI